MLIFGIKKIRRVIESKNCWLLSALLLSLILPLQAQELDAEQQATGPHIEVRLLNEDRSLVPGKTHWLGIELIPETDWHTYWQNPGDSGEPPQVSWSADAPLTFSEIQWPLPKAIPVAHLVNFGYEGANLLMVPVTVPGSLEANQSINIKADLSWLVCKEDCIPGWATLQIDLPTASTTNKSDWAFRFEETRSQLPQDEKLTGLYELSDNQLILSLQTPSVNNDWHLFPVRPDTAQHNQPQKWLSEEQSVTAILPVSDYFQFAQQDLDFLLSNGETGYYFTANFNNGVFSNTNDSTAIWLVLLMALAGGIILNIMPCVLPVLSFKALSLQHQQNKKDHNWYGIGVLACFNLFALLIVGLQSTGELLGWGFHMQQPLVVAGLAVLFTWIALSLWDVFPDTGRFSNLGQNWISGNGKSSHFFTGVLAVVVASPCTAPFMAAALGVAFVSDWYVTLLIFNSLAIGFALPLMMIVWLPSLQRLLPRPGPWMVRFKQFLGFPMLATVVWLVWVYLQQTGPIAQLSLLSILLFFALGAWVSQFKKWLGNGLLLTALLALLIIPESNKATSSTEQATQYKNFTEQFVLEMRRDNQLVLVNLTADWCITCKVNEQLALSTDTVQQALESNNVHYVVGDWTNKNDEIFQYLTRYQRAGVPLYVIYAGEKYHKVLPQVLTPEIVVNAIQSAKLELENET